MHIIIRTLTVLAVFICVFKPAHSFEHEPFSDLTFYGSFIFNPTIPNTLFFFDEISESDTFELRKALRNHEIEVIVLSSPGGSVWEGLQMAGIIHDKGLTTFIPKEQFVGEGNCASACSFMFFAGAARSAEGKLGVHQFYSSNQNEKKKVNEIQNMAQFTVSEIIGFLNEFNAPPFVYERMFQQQEMYYFNPNEMRQIITEPPELNVKLIKEINQFINYASNYLELERVKKAEKTSKTTEKINPAGPTEPLPAPLAIEKSIQFELKRVGCYGGSIDGVIGPKSIEAIKAASETLGIGYDSNLSGSKLFLEQLTLLTETQYCPVKKVKLLKPKSKYKILTGDMTCRNITTGIFSSGKGGYVEIIPHGEVGISIEVLLRNYILTNNSYRVVKGELLTEITIYGDLRDPIRIDYKRVQRNAGNTCSVSYYDR